VTQKVREPDIGGDPEADISVAISVGRERAHRRHAVAAQVARDRIAVGHWPTIPYANQVKSLLGAVHGAGVAIGVLQTKLLDPGPFWDLGSTRGRLRFRRAREP
jgi:hypothetical protein